VRLERLATQPVLNAAAGRQLGEGDPGEFSGQSFMGFCWDFEFWWSDFGGIDGLLMVLVG